MFYFFNPIIEVLKSYLSLWSIYLNIALQKTESNE